MFNYATFITYSKKESFGNNLYNRNGIVNYNRAKNQTYFCIVCCTCRWWLHIKKCAPTQTRHKKYANDALKLQHPHVALHKMCPLTNGLMNWNATSRKPRPHYDIFHIHAHWLKTFCSGDRWHMVKYHNWRLPLFSKDAVLKTSLLAIVGYLWIMYR